jgi:thioredoxin-like negative regulator of GroEL
MAAGQSEVEKERRMSRRPPSNKGGAKPEGSFAKLRAEIDRLRRELAQAQGRIEQLEQGGADPLVAKRLAELEEGQKVARGLAVEAAVARSRAEAELKTLSGAIEKAPSVHGWLLRRALRRAGGPGS